MAFSRPAPDRSEGEPPMAIDRVDSYVLVHKMERGRGPSIANYRTRESVVVTISDRSGASGWHETYASAGSTSLKMRAGRYPIGHERGVIEKLRADYPKLDFRADGNAAYTLPRAIEMGRGLARLGFKWFEEPIPQSIGGGDEYAGYERMREALDLPLAGGEGLTTR